jgi:hypothetical protein
MCFDRAGYVIVLSFSPTRYAEITAFQIIGLSIGEQSGIRKVIARTNGFDCDVPHYATYYSIICKQFSVVLWHLFPKFNFITHVDRTAHASGSITRIDFVGRSEA